MISISVQALFLETQTQNDISFLLQCYWTTAKLAKLHTAPFGVGLG